jgi:NAD(P)H-nitrite reductase large subunit
LTIVSAEDYPAYSRCLIPYFMAGRITEDDMLYRPKDYYQKNRFEVMLGRRAVAVDPTAKTVTLDNDEKLPFDRLLIATGGTPKMPDAAGMDKDGITGFRTTEDLKTITEVAGKAKQALVLGGGCVGLMAAHGLHAMGLKVTVVIRSPHLFSQVADAEAGEIFRQRFEANGIPVRTGTDVSEVLGKKKVEGVRLSDGMELPCQLIVVGKGVNPTIDLVAGTDIRTHWGIVVNDEMQTSVADIYAAGDVAETTDVVTGEQTVNAIWPAAAEQGRIAGANMTGEHRKYEGSIRMNAVEFFGLPMISTGVVNPTCEGYKILAHHAATGDVYRKVVLCKNVVVGVVLVGEIGNAGVFADLMRKKVDVSTVKDQLLKKSFGFADVLPLVAAEPEKFRQPEYGEAILYGRAS